MARLTPDVQQGQFWLVRLVRPNNEVVAEIMSVFNDGTVEARVQLGTDLTPWNGVWFLAPKFRKQFIQKVWPKQIPGLVSPPGLPTLPPAVAAELALPLPPRPSVPRRRPVEELAQEALARALRSGHPSHWRNAWGLFMNDPERHVKGPYETPFLLWKLSQLEAAGKVCSEAAETSRRRLAELGYEGCAKPFEPPPPPAPPAPPPSPTRPPAAPRRPAPAPVSARPRGAARASVDAKARQDCEKVVVKVLSRQLGLKARAARERVRSVAEQHPEIACNVEMLLQAVLRDLPTPPGTSVVSAPGPEASRAAMAALTRRSEMDLPPLGPPLTSEARQLEADYPELTAPATPRRPPPPIPAPPPPVPPPPPPPVVVRPPMPLPPMPAFQPPADPLAYADTVGEWSTGFKPSSRASDKTLHQIPAPGDPQIAHGKKPPREPESGEWTYHGQLLSYFLAQQGPISFTRIAAELGGSSAKNAMFTVLDTALWALVDDDVVEHTTRAPIRFRLVMQARGYAESDAEPPTLGVSMGPPPAEEGSTEFAFGALGPPPREPDPVPSFAAPFAELARVTDRDPEVGEIWLAQDGGITYPVFVVDVNDSPLAPEGGLYTVQGLSGDKPFGPTWPMLRQGFLAPAQRNPVRMGGSPYGTIWPTAAQQVARGRHPRGALPPRRRW